MDSEDNRVSEGTVSNRVLLVTLFAAVVLVAAVALIVYEGERDNQYQRAAAQLTAIADLKTANLDRWREDRLAEVNLFADNEAFALTAHAALDAPPASDAYVELVSWLTGLAENHNYESVFVLDASGDVRAMAGLSDSVSSMHVESVITDGAREARIVDLHLGDTGKPHMSLVAPIGSANGPVGAVGTLVATIDPEEFLYPFIQGWPVPSETGETLLIRQDGGDALFLNDLRFRQDAALELRVPMTSTTVPAVAAALGEEGVIEGIDYRGVDVIADVRHVPDSPWYLVAKIDAREAYADLRTRLLALGLLAAVTVLAVALSVLLLWRNRRARFYRERYQIERERSWLRDVIARSATEVYVLDPDTLLFAFASEGACRSIGYTADELASMTPLDIVPTMDKGEFDALVSGLMDGDGTQVVLESVHRRKDGTTYPAEIRIQRLDSDEGPVLLVIGDDITKRVRAERELAAYREQLEALVEERTRSLVRANEDLDMTNEELQTLNEEMESAYEEVLKVNQELEEANATKNRFLASMSHELRTPLNSIIGFSGILLAGMVGEVDEEQTRQIEMIQRSGRYLMMLVNDILDLEKIEAGAVELRLGSLDLRQKVKEAADAILPAAEEKGLAVVTKMPEEPVFAWTDEDRFRQILFNLLSNAVKFTQNGTIAITVEHAENRHVSVRVEDTGPGIDAEEIESIFDEFRSIGRPSDTPQEGTGLGLAISRRLALMLGGDISVESERGVGAKFTLTLPVDGLPDQSTDTGIS